MNGKITNRSGEAGSLSGFEIEGFLDGSDIFNSESLYRLSTDTSLAREEYLIKTELYRPDLVAKSFYGDEKYQAFVILQAGSIQNIKPGNILKLLSKDSIKKITGGR